MDKLCNEDTVPKFLVQYLSKLQLLVIYLSYMYLCIGIMQKELRFILILILYVHISQFIFQFKLVIDMFFDYNKLTMN